MLSKAAFRLVLCRDSVEKPITRTGLAAVLRRNTYLRCIINSWMQFDTIRNDAWNRACTARGCCFGLNQTRVYLLLQHFHFVIYEHTKLKLVTLSMTYQTKNTATLTHTYTISAVQTLRHMLSVLALPSISSIKLKDAEVTIDRVSLTLEHAVAADRCVWQPSWLPRVLLSPSHGERNGISEWICIGHVIPSVMMSCIHQAAGTMCFCLSVMQLQHVGWWMLWCHFPVTFLDPWCIAHAETLWNMIW